MARRELGLAAEQADHHEERDLAVDDDAAQVVDARKQPGVLNHQDCVLAAHVQAGRDRHALVLGTAGEQPEAAAPVDLRQERALVRVGDTHHPTQAEALKFIGQQPGPDSLRNGHLILLVVHASGQKIGPRVGEGQNLWNGISRIVLAQSPRSVA